MPLLKPKTLPNAYTILFLLTCLVGILSHFVNVGRYDYKSLDGKTIVKAVDATTEKQLSENLIPIAHTFTPLPKNPQSIMDIALAPIRGIEVCSELIVFVLMLGAFLEVINKTKTLNALLSFILVKTQKRKVLVIPLLVFIFSLGGTIFGLKEETIVFFPLLIVFMLQIGLDPLLGVAIVLIGSSVGILGSTVNPFAVGTATQVAGIPLKDAMGTRVLIFIFANIIASCFLILYAKKIQKDFSKSLVYTKIDSIKNEYFIKGEKRLTRFTKKRFAILIIFIITFGIMTYNLLYSSSLNKISGIFILASVLIAFVGQIPEKEFIKEFKKGASNILPIGLIIGISRGVTLIMSDSMLKDTLLHKIELIMPYFAPSLFTIICFFIIFALYFLISSSSGMAMLIIPILTPLAHLINAPVPFVIIAYLGASGIAPIINPTGAILGTALEYIELSFIEWVKFSLPLVLFLTGIMIITLLMA